MSLQPEGSYETMFDPSVLAPFVTRTFVHAWLSVLTMRAAAAKRRIAVVILLILYFGYY